MDNHEVEGYDLTVFENLGKLHNDGLIYVFSKIQEQPETRSGGRDISDKTILLEYLNDFFVKLGMEPMESLDNLKIPSIILSNISTSGVFIAEDLTQKKIAI